MYIWHLNIYKGAVFMSEAFYVPDGTTIVSKYIIPYGEDTVILPDSVKEIADKAFQNNEFLP